MANETTTTTMDDLVNAKLVQAEIIEAAWPQLVCQPLCMERDISGQKTNTAHFAKWGTVSAAAVAESDDLSPSQMSSDGVDISASEVGVMILLKDKLTYSSILAGISEYGVQLGKAVADKIDADIAALFAGFTNSVGSSGTNIADANILAAIYTLENANAPKPFVCVLHPIQISDLRTEYSTATGVINFGTTPNDIGAVANGGYFGTRYRVDFFETTNVATANTGADRCGAMFSARQALGIVFKKYANVELQRDASARGTEIVVTADYGVGEVVDAYGVKIVTDA